MKTTEVENYPGFKNGIMGPELMDQMREQAKRFGASIVDKNVSRVDFSGDVFKVWGGEELYETKSVIIATGAESIMLKIKGEKDDFYSMVIGFAIYSLAHFAYLFVQTPLHVYLVQFLMGLAAAFAFTPWYGFFARHIDKNHESFEWGIAISMSGFGLAAASFAAGIIVDSFGFAPIFIISGTISLLGTIFLLLIRKKIKVHMKKGRYSIKIKKIK